MNCFHCNLAVPENTDFKTDIEGATRPFCCPGCLAVAQHLCGMGLDQYYQLRLAPARRPDPDGTLNYAPEIEEQFTSEMGDGLRHVELAIEGITCGGCAWLIEHALDQLDGVSLAVVNLAQHRVRIHYSADRLNSTDLIAAVDRVGYRASPWRASEAAIKQKQQRRTDMTRLIVSGLGAMQAMMFAVALYTADASFIEVRHEQLLRWISLLVSVPVMVYAARPFYAGALQALRHRRLTMDIPVSTALSIAWISSIWHVFQGQGEVYFDSVSMFVFFLLTGRYFERSMLNQGLAASGLDRMPLPSLLTRLDSEGPARVMLDQIRVGDRIQLQGGEHLAVDGRIIEGRGEVSQAHMTGESEAIPVEPGVTLLAGSLNGPTPLVVEVTATGEQRTLAQLENAAAIAQKSRPKTLRWAQSWAGRFVAFQLSAAFFSGLYWYFTDPSQVLEIVVAVLVATCPCAFALAAPTAMGAALAGARRCGAALLSADALERLASVRQTLTDKTGTLTLGQPSIVDFKNCSDHPDDRLYAIAAGLEQGVHHPLARPFQGIGADPIQAVEVTQGAGVSGQWQGQFCRMGSSSWLNSNPPDDRQWIGLEVDQQLWGWWCLQDQPRPDLHAALQALPQPITVVSGDQAERVKRFCDPLKLDWVAPATPQTKLETLRKAQAKGPVLALGDGINDAPLMAAADASIALTDASALTRSRSDALILGQSLMGVPNLLRLARKTSGIVRQNLLWAIGYNASVLPLAAIGWLPAWGAALGMSLSSLLVVFNAMRLSKG